jgi:hypothetical protein
MPGVTDIVAAFEHYDRVCQVLLWDISSSLLERVLASMQRPFPALTSLRLSSDDNEAPALPDSFLGGSAPRLQYLQLNCIPFPGLPKLLLFATGLVTLRLRHIPHSAYFSPEVMVIVLSASTRLEEFELTFQSPRSLPDRERRRPPLPTRSIFRALTHFEFHGASELFRGSSSPNRYPSTRLVRHNLLPSSHIPHSTTRPVHQAYTTAQDMR